MRETERNYNPFPIVRDVDFKISFSVMDTNAKKDTTIIDASDTGILGGARQTVNEITVPDGKYADLEDKLWSLDGTYEILPNSAANTETGLWSNAISDENGNFASPPVIRYTFADKLSTLGWTLHFDSKANQYASKVRITAYGSDGVTVIDTGIYENSEPVMSVQHYVGDYYAVEFEFFSTSEPLRRLRLVEVDFGLTKAYDRNSLGSARIIYGADILSRSLPTRELVFSFDNSDKQYNLLNPDGVYQYLQDGQLITAEISIGGKAVDMGQFYFTKADVSKSGIVPEITAHDRIYKLDGTTFEGGGGAAMTLSEAISTILADYDIPVSYEGGAENVTVTLSTPKETTIRECIRMLAQAAMCTVYIDRDGVMRFCRLEIKETEDGSITADELYDYSGVSIADRIDGVTLNVSSDYSLDEDGRPIRHQFTAGNVSVGASTQSFRNPCVAPENGASVAAWLLSGLQRRKNYAVKNRCDPAVEIGDTLRIDDIFGNRETAVVTGIEIDYDGTLSAVTKGVGA